MIFCSGNGWRSVLFIHSSIRSFFGLIFMRLPSLISPNGSIYMPFSSSSSASSSDDSVFEMRVKRNKNLLPLQQRSPLSLDSSEAQYVRISFMLWDDMAKGNHIFLESTCIIVCSGCIHVSWVSLVLILGELETLRPNVPDKEMAKSCTPRKSRCARQGALHLPGLVTPFIQLSLLGFTW